MLLHYYNWVSPLSTKCGGRPTHSSLHFIPLRLRSFITQNGSDKMLQVVLLARKVGPLTHTRTMNYVVYTPTTQRGEKKSHDFCPVQISDLFWIVYLIRNCPCITVQRKSLCGCPSMRHAYVCQTKLSQFISKRCSLARLSHCTWSICQK